MTDRLRISDGDVDTAVVADFERSRREIVGRGAVVAGAVLAGGTIPLLVRVRDAFAQADGDESILSAALGMELTLAAAYQRSQNQLGGIARLFRNQEREHAAALLAALRLLGAKKPTASVDEGALGGLAAAAGRRARAVFATELENAAVKAYIDAHRKLRDARSMQLVTSILGNEGQHLTVLRSVAGRPEVPSAFERGGS
jgi:hypothetical protein